MTVWPIHPASVYVLLVAVLTLRAFGGHECGVLNGWVRDTAVAFALAALVNLIPNRSPGAAVLLAVAYLIGTIALSSILLERWAASDQGFLLYLLTVFSLVLLALFVLSIPLILMALPDRTPHP